MSSRIWGKKRGFRKKLKQHAHSHISCECRDLRCKPGNSYWLAHKSSKVHVLNPYDSDNWSLDLYEVFWTRCCHEGFIKEGRETHACLVLPGNILHHAKMQWEGPPRIPNRHHHHVPGASVLQNKQTSILYNFPSLAYFDISIRK